jgi:hypothetical protein
MSNYELNIVSHHKDFDGKILRKFFVEGIDMIGAYGDELFEIVFKNNTWNKVQVKVSVDGTDILSGQPATTTIDNNMWLVNGYGTLKLRAWPETQQGGAAFVFTSANNSVAGHLHGDLSNRGIIAVAVFTESYVQTKYYCDLRRARGLSENDYFYGSNNAKMDSMNVDFSRDIEEKLVAVGAGQYTEQKISYVQGLIKPVLSETVRIKYEWWNELQDKLRQHQIPATQPSGFPGDQNKSFIDLKDTPRIQPQLSLFPRHSHPITAPVYSRV